MSIRRFTGATARDALRQAREALGEDVMILANRQLDDGVEVLAINETGLAELEAGLDAGALASVTANETASSAALASAAGLSEEVRQALGDLRGAMESRIDGLIWGETMRRAPVGVTVYRNLLGAGFSAALARALTERLPNNSVPDTAMQWVQAELAAKLPVQSDEDQLWREGGVFALVGPTGVGKTTTTAKLAARCVLKFGAERVAMLTTDGYRIGAHEQLLIYGRILGVPVLPAGDADALRDALNELSGKHVVLVDTVGMSQRDRQVAEQAAMLCGGGQPVRRLLVLNAASHGDTLDEVAHAYRQSQAGSAPVGCIISKVDEATHLGAVLDTAIRHRLPIHYVSNGQKVPENLLRPNASKLVARALAQATARSLYTPSEADLAILRATPKESSPQESNDADSVEGPADASRHQPSARIGKASSDRHHRFLRAAVAASAPSVDQARFDQALHDLKNDRAFQLAQHLWRQYTGGDTSLALGTDAVLADVRAHQSQSCEHHLLAWHLSLKKPAATSAHPRLAPSLLFSDCGDALGAPVCHAATPQSTLTTQHEQPALPAGQGDTAPLRARWLSAQWPGDKLVHGFEALSLANMKAMQREGRLWLALCTQAQRVSHQQHVLTVKGLAGSLGYLPAGALSHNRSLWVATAAVQLPGWRGSAARHVSSGPEVGGAEPQPLRLVVVREVDSTSGRCLAQHHGLAALPLSVGSATLAQWLWMGTAVRQCRSWAEMAERRLALAANPQEALPARLLPAAQLGLAAWQAAQRPASAAAVVLGLAQLPKRRLDAGIDAMVRLFAALEFTSEGNV